MTRSRVAVVTGGTGGIGRVVATRLAQDGFAVALTGTSAEVAESAAADAGAAAGLVVDVADPRSCEALIATVVARLGGLDTVVNNAGVLVGGLLGETDEADWSTVTEVDYGGAFRMLRAAAPHLLAEDGVDKRVVNITSVHGVHGGAGNSAYAAAKAAVDALTRSLANEWAARGVTVNSVAPGMIDTAMTAERRDGRGIPKPIRDQLIRSIPIGRLGTPRDVAAAVSFLCSEEAAFVTGQVLGVDGGGTALTNWRVSPLWADARAEAQSSEGPDQNP